MRIEGQAQLDEAKDEAEDDTGGEGELYERLPIFVAFSTFVPAVPAE